MYKINFTLRTSIGINPAAVCFTRPSEAYTVHKCSLTDPLIYTISGILESLS